MSGLPSLVILLSDRVARSAHSDEGFAYVQHHCDIELHLFRLIETVVASHEKQLAR